MTCRECGTKFLRMPGGSTKYCSEGCKPLGMRKWWKASLTICRCDECGEPYTPRTSHTKNRYCSTKCTQAVSERRNTKRIKCKYCGCDAVMHRRASGDYCSVSCATKHTTLRRRIGECSTVEWRGCYVCGDLLGPRPGLSKFCQSCRDALGNAAHTGYSAEFLIDRIRGRRCRVCGDTFTPFSAASTTCSTECYRKTPESRAAKAEWKRSESGKRQRRIDNRKRRARKYGNGRVDSIDPVDVFDRDGWRCKICGIYTPKSLRGTFEDRAPELDHIIPLAAGGTHTHDNVQCSCRSCNGEKGATIYQQTLFHVNQ